MENTEDSLVDFFSVLTSVIQDSQELLDKNVSQKKIISRLISLFQSRCCINFLDEIIDGGNPYIDILNQIPDIRDIKEAISTGCIDQDDCDILIKFFDVVVEMCKPDNIILILNHENRNNDEYSLSNPKINASHYSANTSLIRKSLFPDYVKIIIECITRFICNPNIRLLLFRICTNIVNALIECNWNNNALTWFSRPALSDLLISIACNNENSTNSDLSDIHNTTDIKYSGKDESCNSCYVKYIVLNSILSNIIEILKKLNDSDFKESKTIYLADNLVVCFSISFCIISSYHPNCYNYHINLIDSESSKNWWSLKSELFNIIQFNNLNLEDIRFSNIVHVSNLFFNKLDSLHLNLKKMSTKSHLMRNSDDCRSNNLNNQFFNENLYDNIKIDLPTPLCSMAIYRDKAI